MRKHHVRVFDSTVIVYSFPCQRQTEPKATWRSCSIICYCERSERGNLLFFYFVFVSLRSGRDDLLCFLLGKVRKGFGFPFDIKYLDRHGNKKTLPCGDKKKGVTLQLFPCWRQVFISESHLWNTIFRKAGDFSLRFTEGLERVMKRNGKNFSLGAWHRVGSFFIFYIFLCKMI